MIPAELEERIMRLYFVEKWRVGTIANQIGVHHTTVSRVPHSHGITQNIRRPSMIDPYLPFIAETLKAYPTLPASRLHQMVVERGWARSASSHIEPGRRKGYAVLANPLPLGWPTSSRRMQRRRFHHRGTQWNHRGRGPSGYG